MKLIIEVKKLEDSTGQPLNLHEAVLLRGEPELRVPGAINVSCRGVYPVQTANNLMELLRKLGWKGGFEVHSVLEYPASEELEVETQYQKVPSRSRGGIEHTVSYNPTQYPEYQCTCEHFQFRLKAYAGKCEHIKYAIDHHGLGQ